MKRPYEAPNLKKGRTRQYGKGLTQQRHSSTEAPRSPSCHNRQHNGEECSYSYPKHPPSPQPPEEFGHTSPGTEPSHIISFQIRS